ncbi:Ldh family oxidoreductase [Candidatus Eisenbacteria bacterium]|uniref:Ldh family oxidoreductase n=1 Tax=Eiseniibacteriota bacterium TaxID=2212470 RepID=A0ABV6YJK5_UNCEI
MDDDHQPQIGLDLWKTDRPETGWLHEVECELCRRCGTDSKVARQDLETFVTRVLAKHGVPAEEGDTVARVLVAADLRGIASHGVARLGRYLNGIEAGYIRPGVDIEVTEAAASIATIDARHGLGQVAAARGMNLAIAKAQQGGVGVVTVKNSNHYGIAGYYVQTALDKRLIGISMTNAAPLVIPTHGTKALLGTNPIAFGMPAARPPDFLLDMATSVVTRGKLEVHDRNHEQMPQGWAVDENGYDCQDPGHVIANLVAQAGGGILPLGGRGETFGGHKGYGLAVMTDLLCGVLAGSAYGRDVNDLKRELPKGEIAAPRVGHFFLALAPERFMPLSVLEQRVDAFITMIKRSPKANNSPQIFIHGEKEHARALAHEKSGIPIAANVLETLRAIATKCGVEPPRTLGGS